jgi:cytochrome b561
MSRWQNSDESYSTVAKFLHWTIAILIILMLIMGNSFDLFPVNIRPQIYMLHKSAGLLILALVVLRIVWRLAHKQPSIPEGYSRAIHLGAKAGHYALYVLMFTMPFSGWLFANPKYPLDFFGLFPVPHITNPEDADLRKLAKNIHGVFANLFIVVISAHVLAALYHHYVLKDNILTRMLPSCVKPKKN